MLRDATCFLAYGANAQIVEYCSYINSIIYYCKYVTEKCMQSSSLTLTTSIYESKHVFVDITIILSSDIVSYSLSSELHNFHQYILPMNL
jgi:hypothetical protein